MYAGEVVETATTPALFAHPSHPYTVGLLHSLPHTDPRVPLVSIEGAPPDLEDEPLGCPFEPRCAWRIDVCSRKRPPLTPIEGATTIVPAGPNATHRIACHNPPTQRESIAGHPEPDRAACDADQFEAGSQDPSTANIRASSEKSSRSGAPVILEVSDLAVYFPIRRGLILDRHVADVRAVDGVS